MISLEKYNILREIGKGGMGLVYLAIDLKLDRTVAIKELIIGSTVSGKDREDIISRFKREAQTAAKLSHPNIITIYDVGEEQQKHYIAMEYLPGKTLKDYFDEKFEFSLEEAIDILLQIASGLDHAHSKSIIHRDIKPENIKVLDNNVIKLMDFGIASIENKTSGLTQDGTLLGTIAYISPEQLYNSKNVDTRADIFSFGSLIYEMFTGRLPFDADTIGATIVKIMSENPKPPKQINPNIKSELEDIILRCLEKDPDKRYQKAKDV
ncbi:MAG: serine/threonine protein kinase, partial [Candidatus Sericytochromatia bacterium]|nr:serine/threonine protein kinase [Candidatus Sericytochromatia bacterium]